MGPGSATGRKVASPALVLRGSGRLTAAALTRLGLITIDDLAAVDLAQWRDLRRCLERRHHETRAFRALGQSW